MARVAKRHPLFVGLLIGLVGIPAASADERSPLPVSPRVRVTAPTVSAKRLIGTLVGMDDATLVIRLQERKDVIELARSSVTRIEVSRVSSRKSKGAKIGALVGLGAAVAIGLGLGEDCDSRPEPVHYGVPFLEGPAVGRRACMGKGETAVLTSLLTVPTAALIGLGVAPGEKWVRAAPDRIRVALTPVRGTGIGAALSVRF